MRKYMRRRPNNRVTCGAIYNMLLKAAMTFKEIAYAFRDAACRTAVWRRLNEMRAKGMIRWQGKGRLIEVV